MSDIIKTSDNGLSSKNARCTERKKYIDMSRLSSESYGGKLSRRSGVRISLSTSKKTMHLHCLFYLKQYFNTQVDRLGENLNYS